MKRLLAVMAVLLVAALVVGCGNTTKDLKLTADTPSATASALSDQVKQLTAALTADKNAAKVISNAGGRKSLANAETDVSNAQADNSAISSDIANTPAVTTTVTTPVVTQTVTSPVQTVTVPPVTVTQTVTGPQNTTTTATTPSTTTSAPPTTTTTGTTTTPSGSVVPCPLTHAAGADGTSSCWATNTGVQSSTGVSEAQIKAGAAGFTKVSGNVAVSKAGTVIDHEWINGCVAISASNVTIENSLITPPDGDYCEGGNSGTAPSAINDGNGSTPTGVLVQSVTVDGGNASGNQFGVSINNGNCVLCNVQGFAKNFATGGGTASAPALFEGDYSHDLSTNSCAGYSGGCTTPAGGASSDCAHDNGFYMNSSDYETLQDDYSILTGAGYCTTGAITNLADYGAPSHMTVEGSYMEGDTGADLYTGKAGECGTPSIVIENNAFSNDNGYSGTDLENYWTGTGNTWSGNVIAETGATFKEPGTDSTC